MSDADSGPSTNSKARVPPTPTNLRFQRRTSERAFYEGALREGGMDYPGAGTSPWASSPDASRTSFQSDVPRADLPSPVYQQHEGEASGSGPAPDGEEQPHEQSYPYPVQAGSWSPEQQHQWQQRQRAQQEQQQQEQQRVPGEENRRPQSARYHGVPPQQRQHMPQYKLQAKISGMERSGKKDPILKFDVYVWLLNANVH